MNQEQERPITEPDAESGNYEAQAGSSTPVRERETDDMEAIDRRASTTKTQPMARLGQDRPASTRTEERPDGSSGLINRQRLEDFTRRWDSVQAGFVDDPRRTVEQADRLVVEVIDDLAKMFKDERAKLEQQWSQNGKANTEDLRVAMQRYHDFFRTLVGG